MEISGLILTYNEALNIGRVLEKLSWLNEIVIVDSGSDDETLEIVKKFPNARLVVRSFDNHTNQWNYGVEQVSGEWVLSLDSDYILSDEIIISIQELGEQMLESAFYAHFKYCISGKPLSGTLYPDRAVLFDRKKCHYIQDGHTQLLSIDGTTKCLEGFIFHDDRKPLIRWLNSQISYARLEANHLFDSEVSRLSPPDRIRKRVWLAAPVVFFYTLFFKRCLFDGWHGWMYVLQRTYAEVLISLFLLDRKLSSTFKKKD
jgi:glycosyltransferase involved in cell wall biosynthesis